MIDEKKIEEAANDYADSNNSDTYTRIASMQGFIAGIQWFKENLWHEANEEPKDKSAILLRYTGSMCKWASLDEVDADDWNDTVKELGITRWLYIEDLLKGGE